MTIHRAAFLGFGLLASIAWAQPAVVYDMGGKFDKSFNEAAYNGAERWKKETGKPYLDFEIANEAQREQAMRRMAERGANPVIGVGFSQASLPTGLGGTLLVQIALPLYLFPIPPLGASLTATLPGDIDLFGATIDLQAVEFDAGATDGFSFTDGLELTLGI